MEKELVKIAIEFPVTFDSVKEKANVLEQRGYDRKVIPSIIKLSIIRGLSINAMCRWYYNNNPQRALEAFGMDE